MVISSGSKVPVSKKFFHQLIQLIKQRVQNGQGHLSKPKFRGGAAEGNSPRLSDFASESEPHGLMVLTLQLPQLFRLALMPELCALAILPALLILLLLQRRLASPANFARGANRVDGELVCVGLLSTPAQSPVIPPRILLHSQDTSTFCEPPSSWKDNAKLLAGLARLVLLLLKRYHLAGSLPRSSSPQCSSHQGQFQVGAFKPSVKAQPLLPDQPVGWKCPLCDMCDHWSAQGHHGCSPHLVARQTPSSCPSWCFGSRVAVLAASRSHWWFST